MATRSGLIFTPEFTCAKRKTITLSGTVKSTTGVGLVRKILVYKKFKPSLQEDDGESYNVWAETISESDGTFTLDVYGGSHDSFRVIAVGNEGENSAIYEHIVEGEISS